MMTKNKWVNFIRNVIFAFVSGAITLVCAELVYEQFEPPEIRKRFINNLLPLMDYDPDLGWKNRADTQGTFLAAGTNVSVEIHHNHEGMRYRELTPKTGFRVAVIGDSLVWGYAVNDEQRFTNLIEATLHIDMLNYGVVGYGPLQYYLELDKIIEQKPDLVVLAFTLYNDFQDSAFNTNAEFYRPYAVIRDGTLLALSHPAPNFNEYIKLQRPEYTAKYALGRLFYDTLRRTSPSIFNYFYGINKKLPARHGRFDFRNEMLYDTTLSLPAEKILEINKALLKLIRYKLAEHNIKLIILACPTNFDINGNTLTLLKKQGKELNIPVFDIPAFEKGNKYTSLDHVHWNSAGQKLAADALAAALKPYLPK